MDMSPQGQTNTSPTQLQFTNSSFTPGGSNYTPPVTQQQQQIAPNTAVQQQSPYGISPNDAGNLAATFIKKGFGNQVATSSGSLASNATTSFDVAQAQQAGLGEQVAGFQTTNGATDLAPAVNAAGDSVEAGTGIAAAPGLGSILGAGALGALGGGFLAKSLGENQLGGSIGGGIGAAAGMAFGGAGAAALGLELGSFAGPVGALVGGIGGALIGGAFGNNTKPTSASEFLFSPSASGGVNNETFGAKGNTSNINHTLVNDFSSLTSGASKALGINFNPNAIVSGGFNSMYSGGNQPGYIGMQTGQRYYFDPNDPASKNTAYLNTLTDAAKVAGYTDTTALTNWFNSNVGSNGKQNGVGTAQMPSIPVAGQSFADFISKTKGTSNGTNGTPSV